MQLDLVPREPERARDPDDVVASAQGISKKFCRRLRRSMAYGVKDLAASFVGMQMDRTRLRKDEFWAIKDVSFDVRRGERLGIIGMNGCGKTTLLRLLGGIMPPDSGEIHVKGRVGALIAVGAGFHPHMTGRENVYLNGSLLGMSRHEIDEKFETITEFAGIGEFLDSPVAVYSNGMRVRLGFAVATALEPDLLLLDEIFAVGDMVFRQRCIDHLRHASQDTALVLVHNRPHYIQLLCERAIWLHKGKVQADGDVSEVADLFMQESERQSTQFAMRSTRARAGSGEVRFGDDARTYSLQSGKEEVGDRGDQVIIESPFVCHESVRDVSFSIELEDPISGFPIAVATCDVPEIVADGTIRCSFAGLPLNASRTYSVTLGMTGPHGRIDILPCATAISVVKTGTAPTRDPGRFPHEIVIDMNGRKFRKEHKPQKEKASESNARRPVGTPRRKASGDVA